MKDTTNIEEKLIASFRDLAMKEPVERITIREIADGAGVIRTTFYYHFQDKYELIERIIKQNLVDPIARLCEEHRIDEALLILFRQLDADRAFYKRLAKMEGQNSFEEILKMYISDVLEEMIQKIINEGSEQLTRNYEWLTPKLVADYYAWAVTYALIAFLNTSPPAKPEEAAEVFDFTMRHSLSEAVRAWYLGS